MYKPGDASKLLNIPESTLRRLAKQFENYLSPQQPGRTRQYSERDISILERARALLQDGMRVKQVYEELSKVIDLLGEQPPEPEREAEPENTSLVIRQLSELSKQYSSLESELERLRAEHEEDRARLARLERWFSLPFWKRILSKPPE